MGRGRCRWKHEKEKDAWNGEWGARGAQGRNALPRGNTEKGTQSSRKHKEGACRAMGTVVVALALTQAAAAAAAIAWPSWVLHGPSEDRSRAAAKINGQGREVDIRGRQAAVGERHWGGGEQAVEGAGQMARGDGQIRNMECAVCSPATASSTIAFPVGGGRGGGG